MSRALAVGRLSRRLRCCLLDRKLVQPASVAASRLEIPGGLAPHIHHDVSRCMSTYGATRARTCDVCGSTTSDVANSGSKWDFCEGLQMQFCDSCRHNRGDALCDKEGCQADACSAHRERHKAEAPAAVRVCDVCGASSDDGDFAGATAWEYCEGLKRQFCGYCRADRAEPPCHNPACGASVCRRHREPQQQVRTAEAATPPVDSTVSASAFVAARAEEAAGASAASQEIASDSPPIRVLVDYPADGLRLAVDLPESASTAALVAAVARAAGLPPPSAGRLRLRLCPLDGGGPSFCERRSLGPAGGDPSMSLGAAGIAHHTAVIVEEGACSKMAGGECGQWGTQIWGGKAPVYALAHPPCSVFTLLQSRPRLQCLRLQVAPRVAPPLPPPQCRPPHPPSRSLGPQAPPTPLRPAR